MCMHNLQMSVNECLSQSLRAWYVLAVVGIETEENVTLLRKKGQI